MADEAKGQERRQAQRFSCIGEAEIVVTGSGLRYAGRLANLSATGCFVETSCRLERGTSVEVWMSTEGLPLRVAANLLVRRPNGVGLRFHSVSSRRLEQIRALIAELERAISVQEEPLAAEIGEEGAAPGAACHGGRCEIAECEGQRGEEPCVPVGERGRVRRLLRTLYSLCVRAREYRFRRGVAG